MELTDCVIMVTGAGSGIGAELCRRFARESPKSLTLIDLDASAAESVAQEIRDDIADTNPATQLEPIGVDVSNESQLRQAIAATSERFGTVDLFVGNAGIGSAEGIEASNDTWRRVIDVNLMSHVYAARALLPAWLERGEGRLIITASAAGLLTNLGDAPYSITKHGAVALAEWLSVTYGERGLVVSCLCPQGVRTPLLFPEMARNHSEVDDYNKPDGNDDANNADQSPEDLLALQVVRAQRILEPADVAASVMEAIGDGRFLILPHEEVATYEQARASDREKWLRSMRRLQAQVDAFISGES